MFRRLLVFILLLVFVAPMVSADPPDWAPAHGWRKKHDRDDDDDDHRERHKRKHRREREEPRVGYEGKRWPSDYGILHSQCNRQMVGAVLGGVVGGVIGGKVAREEDRAIATVVGSVIGAVIGAQIGRSMDDADRACVGHALELADGGRAVHWTNEHVGAQYLLSPGREFSQAGKPCREFSLAVTLANRHDVSHQKACRNPDGVWAML